MATWVIGDIHGQWTTLEALLERLDLDEARDSLWLVGDLVNRGPDSLAVLRWARERQAAMGERFVVTLGNHDVHLLALASGVGGPRRHDRLEEVLAAPEAVELIGWLATRPLLHRQGTWTLVHAGLLPSWSLDEAQRRARAVERVLSDPASRPGLLTAPAAADETPPALAMLRRDLGVFTRLRTMTAYEEPCRWTGPPEGAPDGCRAWFDWPHARGPEAKIACGHWAALGYLERPDLVALDSGVAWGGKLTAIRLEDRRVAAQLALDSPA